MITLASLSQWNSQTFITSRSMFANAIMQQGQSDPWGHSRLRGSIAYGFLPSNHLLPAVVDMITIFLWIKDLM